MPIRLNLTSENIRGLMQLARERSDNDDPGGITLRTRNDADGVFLEEWNTTLLGALPSQREIDDAALREELPERKTESEIIRDIRAIKERLDAGGL